MSLGSGIGGGSLAIGFGNDLTNTDMTVLTGGSRTSQSEFGSYVEVVAAADNVGYNNSIIVNLGRPAGQSADTTDSLVSIAIGGSGSEVDIIDHLVGKTTAGATGFWWSQYFIPIGIPEGVRISARSRSSNSNGTTGITVTLIKGDLSNSTGLSVVDTIGDDVVDPAGVEITTNTTVDTFGSWIEVSSSTPSEYKGFLLAYTRDVVSNTDLNVIYEMAIGSSGNEEIIFSGQQYQQSSSETGGGVVTPFIPVTIPAGSRIAMRAQSNISNTDADADVIFYGVR